MRIWICLFLSAMALGAAEKPAGEKKSAKPAAKQAGAARKPAAAAVPAGAVESEPGLWRHTDEQGRKWIYRKTPWGVSRVEDKPQSAKEEKRESADRKAGTDGMKAFDDGEFVRFERPGPFGIYKWRKKKSELDEAERRAWERAGGSASRDDGKQE
jgi:hypothetical protein